MRDRQNIGKSIKTSVSGRPWRSISRSVVLCCGFMSLPVAAWLISLLGRQQTAGVDSRTQRPYAMFCCGRINYPAEYSTRKSSQF